jgi:hypothetical protein
MISSCEPLRCGITISGAYLVFQCMKKLLVFMALMLTTLTMTPVYANPDFVLNVNPEPVYDQMWAFETYSINITLGDLNLTEYSDHDLNGRVIAEGIVKWRGTGQYHHGAAVTGYSYILDEEVLRLNASLEDPSFIFNLTLSKDAFHYGMKPFENVEIQMSFDLFLEQNNETGVENGPLLGSVSSMYILLDDEKVEYLQGKLHEMADDVNAATMTLGIPDFNRTKYESMVSSMNASIITGNYLEAQDQWESWADKDRLRMLNAFSRQVDTQAEALEAFDVIETELESVESELQRSQIEYDLIEDKYFALLSDNAKTKVELESAKQGVTTAITSIFLAAIVFFFLGRRVNKTEVE